MLRIKRVYEKPSRTDGRRILVDRLWPRGVTKERAALSEWLKDIAPSAELRKWFAHDPEKWREFQTRYRKELADKKELVRQLQLQAKTGAVTLVYAARDAEHNEAVVLKRLLEGKRR